MATQLRPVQVRKAEPVEAPKMDASPATLPAPTTESSEQKSTTAMSVPAEDKVQVIADDPTRPRVVITRGLPGERLYEPGEVIEIEPGRRRVVLERSRYIRALNYGELLFGCPCGQLWIDRDKAEAHQCT